METTDRPVAVFFTIDDAYAPFLAVAITSLIEHASPQRSYHLVVLHEGLSAANQERLAAMAKDNVSIGFVPMEGQIKGILDRKGNRLRADYFTLTIFFRLFIPALFPQYDKGVYVDSDVVFEADVAELFETELDGNLIGACRDLSIVDIPPFVEYVDKAVGVSVERYFNSGVLLMDMAGLRSAGLESRFNRYLHFDDYTLDEMIGIFKLQCVLICIISQICNLINVHFL